MSQRKANKRLRSCGASPAAATKVLSLDPQENKPLRGGGGGVDGGWGCSASSAVMK